jgi:hypothetical protein
MTTDRRAYKDTGTDAIILMIRSAAAADGWTPDIPILNAWRAGNIRLYDTGDGIMTMPAATFWPWMTPTEQAHIVAVVSPPWIPANAPVILPELTDIATLEATPLDDDAWTDYLVPALDYTGQPPPTIIPLPHAVAAPPPPPLPPLPPHVAAIVLAAAATARDLCPITMETIRNDPSAFSVTPCGHVFDTAALQLWCRTHDVCPECRSVIGTTKVTVGGIPSVPPYDG